MDPTIKSYSLALLVATTSERLWDVDQWSHVEDALEGLMSRLGERPVLRITQIDNVTSKPIRFGRRRWGRNDSRAWVHGSDETKALSLNWTFLSVQAWAPSWQTCERNGVDPGLFLELMHYPDLSMQALMLATAPGFSNTVELRASFSAIQSRLNDSALYTGERHWLSGPWSEPVNDILVKGDELRVLKDRWESGSWKPVEGWRLQ